MPNKTTVFTLRADSGRAVNLTVNPNLAVEWKFGERRVDSSAIFTAILDVMVTTAKTGVTLQLPYLTGVSDGELCTACNVFSRRCVPGTISVINQLIRQALLVLARDVFSAERSFLETDFEIDSYGHKVGSGFFLNLDGAPENQTEALASERRSMDKRDFAKSRRHLH